MSEARKIFPMDTFVACLKGDENASVAEMLGYLTQKTLDTDSTPFAAALAKAWIYEQHPELTRMSKGQVVELGQSVSVAPMPVKAKTEVDEVFVDIQSLDRRETTLLKGIRGDGRRLQGSEGLREGSFTLR